MGKHEEKYCPRCGRPFACKPGDITHCQCYAIQLSGEERAFIEERFQDCLCQNCLQELKQHYIFFKEKYFFHER